MAFNDTTIESTLGIGHGLSKTTPPLTESLTTVDILHATTELMSSPGDKPTTEMAPNIITDLTSTRTSESSAPFPVTMTVKNTTESPNEYMCICACINVNSLEFKQEIQRIIDDIDKKMTSLYKNSKISVYDRRLSSVTIGIAGTVCVCFPLALIVSADLCNCFKTCTRRKCICNTCR